MLCDDVGGFVAHAKRAATGAEPALFAREGDEDVVPAGAAMAADKASGKISARSTAAGGSVRA
jgi:hypothetical protein